MLQIMSLSSTKNQALPIPPVPHQSNGYQRYKTLLYPQIDDPTNQRKPIDSS